MMREQLKVYSNILQLDEVTMQQFKHAPDGLVRALQMYVIVTLIAGLGIWFGIPVQLERPVLYEVLSDAQESIDQFTRAVEPFLEQNIPLLATPQDIAAPVGEAATAAGDVVNDLLQDAQREAELLSPPLGTRLSRIIRLFGRWLSVPFSVMNEWFFLVLVAMLAAKMVGGRATLGQHLTAVLLSAAPLVLAMPSYIPNLSPVMPIPYAYAITIISRFLALVGFGWAALILVKGLSLAHEFTWWRSLGVLLLSVIMANVLLPLSLVMVVGYVARF